MCLDAVCDDTCKEVVMDPTNGLLVCTISGRCFDRMLLSPDETESDVVRNLHVAYGNSIIQYFRKNVQSQLKDT